MSRINKLKNEQVARFPEYVEKYIAIGLDTTPVDRGKAAVFVEKLYRDILKKNEVPFVILPNPYQTFLAVNMLSVGKKPWRDQIMDQVWDQVIDQVRAQVEAQVGDQVMAQVRNQVMDKVEAQVREQVWDQVRAQVWAQVRDKVEDQVRDKVEDQVWDQVMAQVRNQVVAQVGAKVREQVRAQVEAQVREQVGDQVRAQVRAQVGNQVGDQVEAQVREQVGDQVREQVRAQVRDQVWAQVGDQVRAQVDSQNNPIPFVWPYLDGVFFSSYFSFINFFVQECGVNINCELYDWYQSSMELSLVYPLDNICVLCEKFSEVHMKDKKLHKDGGPAIRYPDGWSVWALNGVRVPQWLAETPEGQLDPEKGLALENAEQRAQFVKKYGVHRLKRFGKIVDTQGDYDLIDFSQLMPTQRYSPYLFMKNPSVPGLVHAEGVDRECETVEQALNWRNQSDVKPSILT